MKNNSHKYYDYNNLIEEKTENSEDDTPFK